MHYTPYVYIYSIVRLYKNPAERRGILHILREYGNKNRPAEVGREGDRPSGGGGVYLPLRAGRNSAMRMAGPSAPPMSSEETPPLHFRLKPKIPLKLRSFLLSPPDPLRWAPAGAPPFLSAEKEKTLQRAFSPLCGSPWRAVHGPLRRPWRLCRLGLRRPPRGEKRKRLFSPCGSALHSSGLLRKFDG